MELRDLWMGQAKYSMRNGYTHIVVFNENDEPIYEGLPLLTALHTINQCPVLSHQANKDTGTLRVKVSTQGKLPDYNLVTEFIDEDDDIFL